jgi:hypothetical protein
VLPPEREVRITIERDNRVQHWIMVAAIAVGLLILWRFRFGLLLLTVMGGQTVGEALILAVLVLGVAAWREHRAGRPF